MDKQVKFTITRLPEQSGFLFCHNMNYIPVLLMLLFFSPVALAQTAREAVGPSREVVQERLYVFDGRIDLSLMSGLAMNPKLVDHYAFLLRPAFHFTDAWSVEITGGYVLAAERRNLTNRDRDAIRISMFQHQSSENDNEFADMGQMEWLVQGALRWSPIYGKLNLAAELPIHFGAYTSAGVGVAQVFRDSLADCQSVTARGDGYVDYLCTNTTDIEPVLSFALGLRFYFSDWFALRAEFSSFLFPDEYRLDFRSAEPRTMTGWTNILLFLGGMSFYF